MHRSVLLLLVSTLLLGAAVALPLSLEEESVEDSWLEQLLKDNWETEEQLDLDDSHSNSIHKRAAKASSSSSEEHKGKAKDKADSSSSEEHKSTTVPADEESTTQAAARRRREALSDFSADLRRACLEEPSRTTEKPGVDASIRSEFLKILCLQLGEILQQNKGVTLDFEQIEDEDEDDRNTGNAIHKRAVSDRGSSSEEHKDKAKDKADSSGESSEEKKTTTQAAIRRRREAHTEHHDEVDGRQKASEEQELDPQAEKELDEEMARAVADVKDNGSIEDYAQGCEVMEVSSKEANEATYAE